MQDRGVSTRKMEGYAQRLRRGEGSTGADLVRPRLLDFWQVRLAFVETSRRGERTTGRGADRAFLPLLNGLAVDTRHRMLSLLCRDLPPEHQPPDQSPALHQCCESGLLFEVELYLSAGQLPDTSALHLPRGAISLPLALAAARGHCQVQKAVSRSPLVGKTRLKITDSYEQHNEVCKACITAVLPWAFPNKKGERKLIASWC